ncbi:MAG TPA: hypothetical protein VN765_14080 [Candidatus Acidoferrum sp.]|nr:hypothetical protein [Candidatus Acidoferrum sp.]
MSKHASFGALLWLSLAPLAFAQPAGAVDASRVVLGRLANGAAVSFVRADPGDWGIEVSGGTAPRMTQEKPAQIEVFAGGEIVRQLAAGYQSVKREADTIVATAKVAGEGKGAFAVEDRWKVSGAVLSLSRKVSVTGAEDNAGFYSAIRLSTAPTVKWEDVNCLIPGLFYGDPHAGAGSPGGDLPYRAKRFSIREDYLSAPLFGVSFRDGNWAAVLDPAPSGDTTQAETTAPAATPIVDERMQFGALGAREVSEGGIELGFWLPGTTTEFGGGFGMRGGATAAPVVRRRYHPVKAGFSQSYQVGFRFGKSESFRDMEREAWRWAWQSLNPKITPVDVEVVRRTLTDHLADRVLTVEDRAGVPFVIDAVSGKPGSFRPAFMSMSRRGGQAAGATNAPLGGGASLQQNQELADWAKTVGIEMDPQAAELELWPKIMMGFCGKNVEVADQLLQESGRDPGPRGQRMRKLGLTIIESLIRIVPMSPAPAAEGFDIRTGKASAVRGAPAFSLRATAEDMRTMVDLIRRERALGRQHPEWFKWVKSYADWLLTQQREDGSFPGSWQGGTGEVKGTSGVTTYTPVPLLVRMTEETGDKKYLNSAIRAADYIWSNFGSKCVFLGATGGEVADKESGMLSLEAFLALYENTKEAKWLERAETAGSYAESWIWIWNVPMPLGANYSELGWKPGVPTVGVNGIGSNVAGHVDQYLDWAVPSYAKLYKYTKDEHYLDVARVLLHGTKAMLALPGRTYDLKGPGWQQEHWRMGPNVRGIGAHRTWLPWISVNHLHGITGLEEFDKDLYQRLAKGN